MPLDEALLPEAEVTVYWAVERRWEPGDMITGLNQIPTILTLYLVRQGTIELTLDGKTWRLAPDDLFVVPPLAVRDRILTPRGATWLSLGFGLRLYGTLELAPLVTRAHFWRPLPETHARVRVLLEALTEEREEDLWNARPRLARTNRARDPVSRLISEGLAKAIFGLWWREMGTGGAASAGATFDMPRWLLAAMDRMRQEPQLSLAEVQTSAGISGTYLRRQFHHYLGRSPHSYLTECRLNAALALLESTDQTVAVIAAEVGFASLSHFTKLFATRFGMPPARYRLSKQQPTV